MKLRRYFVNKDRTSLYESSKYLGTFWNDELKEAEAAILDGQTPRSCGKAQQRGSLSLYPPYISYAKSARRGMHWCIHAPRGKQDEEPPVPYIGTRFATMELAVEARDRHFAKYNYTIPEGLYERRGLKLVAKPVVKEHVEEEPQPQAVWHPHPQPQVETPFDVDSIFS